MIASAWIGLAPGSRAVHHEAEGVRLAAGPAGGGKSAANNNAIVFAAIGIFALTAVAFMFISAKGDVDSALESAEIRKEKDNVVVVLAARTLYPGVPIAEEDLFLMELPTHMLPTVTDPETSEVKFASVMFNPEQVIGQFPREKILANEYIRQERLADPGSGIGLNALIPTGMRAISVDVSGANALTGFLQPGSYVDILVTMKVGTPPETITKTLLQAVFVLAVNARLTNESEEQVKERGGGNERGITILVTAAQAEDIVTGLRAGTLSLTLRNPQDVTSTPLDGMSMSELLNRFTGPKPIAVPLPPMPAPATPKPAAAPTPTVSLAQDGSVRIQIIKGRTSSEEAVAE